MPEVVSVEVSGDIVREYHDDATLTVHSLVERFDSFTVGVPAKEIMMACGHHFNTGIDDPKYKALTAIPQQGNEDRSYHCIKCQKKVKIVYIDM